MDWSEIKSLLDLRIAESVASGGEWLSLSGIYLQNEALCERVFRHVAEQLSHVTRLDLSYCGVADHGIVHVANYLPNLEFLNLSYGAFQEGAIGERIAQNQLNLRKLKHLNLSECRINENDVATISESLEELTSLALHNCEVGDTGAKHIARLIRLTDLHLSACNLSDVGVIELATNLSKLTQLNIAYNLRVTDRSINCIGEHLKELEVLCLNGCNATMYGVARKVRDNSDVQPTGNPLPKLKYLGLAGQAADCDPLGHAVRPVHDPHVMAIANAFPDLEVLDLAFCRISDYSVRHIGQRLRKLKTLGLNWCERITREAVEALSVCLPNLEFLHLEQSGACHSWDALDDGIDWGVLKDGDAQAIFRWLRDHRHESRHFRSAKMLILGPGRAGKSTLCHRLFRGGGIFSLPEIGETYDFDAHLYQITGDLHELAQRLQFHLWDFGGQPHLHSAHRLFLSAQRSFYVLVFDASRSPEENQVAYWLRFAAHYGRGLDKNGQPAQAPVVIAITQCDKTDVEAVRSMKAALLAARIANWYGAKVVGEVWGLGYPSPSDADRLDGSRRKRLESRHGKAMRGLQRAIHAHAQEILTLDEKVGAHVGHIRDWVEEHFCPPVPLDWGTPELQTTQFQYDDVAFRSFCADQGFDRNERGEDVFHARIPRTLALFNSVGIVHWTGPPESGSDVAFYRRVFNPRWVKTPVYTIVRVAMEQKKTWFPQAELENLLKTKGAEPDGTRPKNDREWFHSLAFTRTDRDNICQLMVACGLAFRVKKSLDHVDGIVVPDGLEWQENKTEWDLNEVAWSCYKFRFLTDRVLMRFLAEYERDSLATHKPRNCKLWRNEAIFDRRSGTAKFEVMVQTEISPPLDALPSLTIMVRGGTPETRKTIRDNVAHDLRRILASEDIEMPDGESGEGRAAGASDEARPSGTVEWLIAEFLINHHGEHGENRKPLGVRELARAVKASPASVNGFLNKYLQGHETYKTICNDASDMSRLARVIVALKGIKKELKQQHLLVAQPLECSERPARRRGTKRPEE